MGGGSCGTVTADRLSNVARRDIDGDAARWRATSSNIPTGGVLCPTILGRLFFDDYMHARRPDDIDRVRMDMFMDGSSDRLLDALKLGDDARVRGLCSVCVAELLGC